MNSLLDDNEPETHDRGSQQDREISLGTTMLLGIFFGLALICAVFFGLGYSMGRKSVQGAGGIASNTAGGNFGSFKPAPGRSTLDPLGSDKPGPTVAVPYVPPAAVPKAAPVAAPVVEPGEAPAAATTAPIVRTPPAASTATVTPAPVAATPGAVTAMVQIAAVTHQEDADYLVSALKRRGYNVAIHTEPQDKFLHVQVGPFPSKKDAEVMRQKLLSDGFNAIVK